MMKAMVAGDIRGVLQLITKIGVSKESDVECNDDDSELMVDEETYIDEGEEEFSEN